MFILLAGALAMSGLAAPSSFATVGDLRVTILVDHQPADAGSGNLITAVRFDDETGDSGLVKVLVEKEVDNPDTDGTMWVPVEPGEAEVKFRLATAGDIDGGQPLPTGGTLTVTPKLTGEGGIATFSSLGRDPSDARELRLSISGTNDPFTTAYRIVPQARLIPPEITLLDLEPGWPFEGSASTEFDIWGDGCAGLNCDAHLRNNLETYTAKGNFGLGVIKFDEELVTCPTQKIIFSNTTFFHLTTLAESDKVLLVEHITRLDMKRATNNGQKHIGWCVGLESPGVWNFPLQDLNENNIKDPGEFYVGMAPKCLNKKTPEKFAPCILSQMGDNDGGSFIRGYLPGGDPPRRT
jgi:hypothetical protein